MRKIINILCALLVISAASYVVYIKYMSHTCHYAIIISGSVKGLFSGNPVMICGHEIGKVKNIILDNDHINDRKHHFTVILDLKQKLNHEYLVATLNTDNFIIGTQSINLEWSNDRIELPKIHNVPQIKCIPSKISLAYNALSKIDIEKLINGISKIPEIMENINEFTKNANQFASELQASIFVNPEFHQKILETAEHIRQTTIQLRIMFNPNTALKAQRILHTVYDIVDKVNLSTRRNAPVFDNIVDRIDRCVKAFSNKPIHFLYNGMDNNKSTNLI